LPLFLKADIIMPLGAFSTIEEKSHEYDKRRGKAASPEIA
jgi:hypothetical protein